MFLTNNRIILFLSLNGKTSQQNEKTCTCYTHRTLVISYNLRIIKEYFQRKFGRKILIFSLGRKNNTDSYKKKSVPKACACLARLLGHKLQENLLSVKQSEMYPEKGIRVT